jgi:hypothetical protein
LCAQEEADPKKDRQRNGSLFYRSEHTLFDLVFSEPGVWVLQALKAGKYQPMFAGDGCRRDGAK